MREIGLHLRYNGSFAQIARKALELELPLFQCFLVAKMVGALVEPDAADIAEFVRLRREHFGNLFVHGSYWINLAGLGRGGKQALASELALAKRLEFTHMILHPGAHNGDTKEEGIASLAKSLNALLARERDITIVLENTAHGASTVGGDFNDFVLLRSYLNHPEKIAYCIDTAHAYAYGYNLVDATEREACIALLDTTLGIENIVLIHLNDTYEKLGSKLDKHQTLGQGSLGETALRAFSFHERLRAIPLLMELPVVSQEEEERNLALVRGWHT